MIKETPTLTPSPEILVVADLLAELQVGSEEYCGRELTKFATDAGEYIQSCTSAEMLQDMLSRLDKSASEAFREKQKSLLRLLNMLYEMCKRMAIILNKQEEIRQRTAAEIASQMKFSFMSPGNSTEFQR